jgi:molybdopterin-binding protein
MSDFIATVIDIQNSDSLYIVRFQSGKEILSMMSLELDQNIKINTVVKLVVKPSHLAIAKKFAGEVSYSNKIHAKIISINNGELLSVIKIKFANTILESIITKASSVRMDLKINDNIIALIKASELSISEIVDA